MKWPNQTKTLKIKHWKAFFLRRAEKLSSNPSFGTADVKNIGMLVTIPLFDWVICLTIWTENCDMEFSCPMRWEILAPTQHDTTRFCAQCNKDVYAVSSAKQAEEYAAVGRCLAIVPVRCSEFLDHTPCTEILRCSAQDEPTIGIIGRKCF
jgi:hypothetical protein